MRRSHRRLGNGLLVFELAVLAFTVGLALVVPMMPARALQNHMIEIGDNFYNPTPLTIIAGDTVQWHNGGGSVHTATSDTGEWTRIQLSSGATSTPITLSTSGTYDYHCEFHAGMTGRIVVQPVIAEFSSSAIVVAGMLAMVIGLIVAARRRK